MESVQSAMPMQRAAEIAAWVRSKGVRLWSENGQLRYKAPKGALTPREIEALRDSRAQLVSHLERTRAAEESAAGEVRVSYAYRAPLTFSQRAHWRVHRLDERPGIRQVASATRLRGPLDIAALRSSLAEIVRRHDALRTRLIVRDGTPMQEILEAAHCDVIVEDISSIPEAERESEVERRIAWVILQPVDVARDPLLAMRLLRISAVEHVLIVALEHSIADGCSLYLLQDELFRAYAQAVAGHPLSLPAIAMQFADYAVWQENTDAVWMSRHGAYWNEWLSECPRLRFPKSDDLPSEIRPTWRTTPIHIESRLKHALLRWCKANHTTVVMAAFAAYVALVLRWCGTSEGVIQYVVDGRVSPATRQTIGYFASILCLRIRLLENDSFADLLRQVTEEYCKAHEHADFFRMAAQENPPEFTRNTAFNWIPQRAATADAPEVLGEETAITRSPIHFVHPMSNDIEMDGEPSVVLFDAGDEIVGSIYFRADRFSAASMERLAASFRAFIEALLEEPARRVKDIALR